MPRLRRIRVAARYRGDASEIFLGALDPAEMAAASKGFASFSGMPDHPIRQGETYTLHVTTLKIFKTKGYEIHMAKVDPEARVFVSHEKGGMIKSWIHYMSVVQEGEDAIWTDDVFVDAGLATFMIAVVARTMYRLRHRNRKARSLASRVRPVSKPPEKAFQSIETDRLVLRAITHGDAKTINTYINDPRIYENVARIAPGQTLEQTLDWISTLEPHRRAGDSYTYGICLKDELIGIISMGAGSRLRPSGMGYWLAPQYWGKGFATEAGKALLAFGKEHLDIRHIMLSSFFADNPASGRVLEKLGFKPFNEGPHYCAGRDEELHTIDTKLDLSAL